MWEEWQICNVEMMPGVRGVEQVHGQREGGRGEVAGLNVREFVVDEGELHHAHGEVVSNGERRKRCGTFAE